MKRWKAVFALLIIHMCLIGFMEGCGHRKVQLVPIKHNEETPISFLKDGQTTKNEVQTRLGEQQVWKLEDGRILIFPLDNKYRVASSAQKPKYHLTLIFDEIDGRILKEHGLVRIR